MRLETFQAMLNPSDTHKDVAIKTGFDAFIDSLKYFFSTGKIEDFGEKAREKQFTRIMSNIKTNLNTTKTGSNDTTVLYKNPKNKIKIEQQGLTIFAVSINQKGETTPNFKMELKQFSGISAMQGFLNAYPLITSAGNNHDAQDLVRSIGQDGVDNVKCNLDPTKTKPTDTQILHTDKENKTQIKQRGSTIISVPLDQKNNPTNSEQELKAFSSPSQMQNFIDGYPLISAADSDPNFHKFLCSISHENVDNIKYNLNTENRPNDTHVLYTDKENKTQIEQHGLNIVSVSLDENGNAIPMHKQTLKEFSSVEELQEFINGAPLISTANGNHDSHKLLLSIRYEGQAFLPNLDKIAQAHFDNVPDEDLDLVEGEQRGEYDDSKRAQTLAHLLRSQPALFEALREHHLKNTVEAADVLDAVYPGHNGKSGFTLLIGAITAARLADDDNTQNRPLITRASQSPAPSTNAINHLLLPMS